MATNYTYEIKYGVVRITHCESDDEEIRVPSKIDGKNVYQICSFAFYELDCKRIILPKSIGKIEDSAFFNLHNLEYFECSHVEDMYYPFATDVSNLEVYTSSYFVAKKFKKYFDANIYKFRKINYDNTFNYKILDEAKKTAKITKFNIFDKDVVFPDEIDGYKIVEIYGKIKDEVTKVKLPKYLEVIPKNFLMNQSSIVEVIFPLFLRKIESRAFKGTKLKEFTLPEMVEYIGDEAFWLDSIIPETIPETIHLKKKRKGKLFIGNKSFVHRKISLNKNTLLDLGDSVFAFSGSRIDNVFFKDFRNIPFGTFSNSSIKNFYNSECIESIGEKAFENTYFECDRGFNLKNAVKAGKNCFSHSNILSVYIGKNLELAPEMFSYSLVQIVNFASNYKYEIIPCRCFAHTFKLTSIEIPSSIKTIQMEAFIASKMSLINLENVRSIHMGAFSNCNEILELNFKKLVELDISSFVKCTSLKSVYFNNSKLDTIEKYAFFGCEKLVKVVLSPYTINLKEKVFMNCIRLKSINTDKVQFIGESTFQGCGLEKVDLKGLKFLGAYSFSQCRQLVTVNLGKKLTGLEEAAFSFCEELKNINVENILYFCRYCLYYTGIESIRFPKNTRLIDCGAIDHSLVKEIFVSSECIDYRAFWYLKYLKEVHFENVENINVTFDNTPYIEKVVVGKRCKNIDYGSFYNLPKLTEFCIQNKKCTVKGKNFSKCPNLDTLYFDNVLEFDKIKKRNNCIKYRKNTSEFT